MPRFAHNPTFRYRPSEALTTAGAVSADGIGVSATGGDGTGARVSDVVLAPATPPDRAVSTATFQRPTDVWSSSSARLDEPEPKLDLPGFEYPQRIGRGGMGVVYRAWQTSLGRKVAIKVLARGTAADREQRLRFHWEAEAAARLQHANIAQIFEIGEWNGLDYLVLELLEGGTLRQFVAGRPQPCRDAAELVEVLARAAHQAHLHGVVHRDLKPDNVLLTVDRIPKISDFGLAGRLEAQQDPWGESVVGTASYMAPEQAWGSSLPGSIGPGADIYSLGAMLYELLAGRTPFVAPDVRQLLEQVWSQPPAPLSRFRPDCPRDLDAICRKCLAKSPGERYPSADSLADDLRRFLRGEPVEARPIGRARRALYWSRRRPAWAALAAVSLLAAAGLVGGGAWYQHRLSLALDEAHANLAGAQDAVDDLLLDVGGRRLMAAPADALLERQVLGSAAGFCQRLVGEHPRDTAVRAQAARAQRQLADIDQLLGATASSGAAYERACELSQALVDACPKRADFRRELAVALNNRANLAQQQRDQRTAASDYGASLAHWETLRAADRQSIDFARGLAATLVNRGRLDHAQGRFADAEGDYRRAIHILEDMAGRTADGATGDATGGLASLSTSNVESNSPNAAANNDKNRAALALAHSNFGALLHDTGQDPQAIAQFDAGLQSLGAATAGKPRALEERLLAGCLLHNLAVARGADRQDAAAAEAYDQAIAAIGALVADAPRLDQARLELADTLRDAAIAAGDGPAARQRLQQAIDLYAGLKSTGDAPRSQLGQSICLERFGRWRLAEADPAGQADLTKSHQLAETLAAAHPEDPEALAQLAAVLASEAQWFVERQQPADARRRLEYAVDVLKRARAKAPAAVNYARQLAGNYRLLAATLAELGESAAAVDASEGLLALAEVDASATIDAGRLLARCVSLTSGIKGAAEVTRDGQPWAEFCARRSVAALAAALRSGAVTPAQLAADRELAPLKDRPDFQALVSGAAAKKP